MIDISDKVAEIKKLVDVGKYFTINRARQFGKTTTMNALKRILHDEYSVVRLDFQAISTEDFANESEVYGISRRTLVRSHRFGCQVQLYGNY